MTIFTRDLNHRILLCLLILFCFRILPYVTCQQESRSTDVNIKSVSEDKAVAIILLVIFSASMVFCCCFYAFYRGTFQEQGDEVLHNNRARSGLDKNVIESLPFFLYSEVKGLKIGNGGVECAICLNEFEDEEKLRWLPPCSHTFHANCIDIWLSSRSTCPVCRSNLSLKPGENFTYPSVDLETGIARRDSTEDIISLTENKNADFTTPRSRSTGLFSNWHVAEIIVPRSHSTGHTLVPLGENLDRFTLQLPEEVQRQLVSLNKIQRSHMDLPRARSSRQGYRSGSNGSEKSGFSQGRETLRRAMSMSLSFSFQNTFVRSTISKNDIVGETFHAEEDKDFGERSFQRLMP